MNKVKKIKTLAKELANLISTVDSLPVQISLLNRVRQELHAVSPFKDEPVDCVQWKSTNKIEANDYNPNAVAPPEMKLLEHSIDHDGFTQPIVTWSKEDKIEVVDGFHRTTVAIQSDSVRERLRGYAPVVGIQGSNTSRNDRIASTIRHNRARGKHKVESMSDIVVELKKRNWSDTRIAKELGMDQDEVLRLCQITGLTDVFCDQDFSKAWDVDSEDSLESLEDFEEWLEARKEECEEVSEDDESDRIFHEYTDWECYKAGFYSDHPPGDLTAEECEKLYAELLGNSRKFSKVLKGVVTEWKHSCEHYLTNDRMNRIAWLGQAALAYELGIPSRFRGGYNLLDEDQKLAADKVALKWLNFWRKERGELSLSLEEAGTSQKVNLY